MRPLRVGLLIAGILVAIVALALLAGGGVLIWAHSTQRDAAGYYTLGPHRYSTSSYALTSESVDLGVDPARWFPSNIATVRIAASSAGGGAFVGIGPRDAVERYLSGVNHAVVTDVGTSPFHVTYREVPGSAAPDPPSSQTFWVADSISGTLSWDLSSGHWAVVVMNADGSKGVDVRLAIGAKTGLLLPAGIVALVVGVLFTIGAVLLFFFALRSPRGATAPPAPPPPRPDTPVGA